MSTGKESNQFGKLRELLANLSVLFNHPDWFKEFQSGEIKT